MAVLQKPERSFFNFSKYVVLSFSEHFLDTGSIDVDLSLTETIIYFAYKGCHSNNKTTGSSKWLYCLANPSTKKRKESQVPSICFPTSLRKTEPFHKLRHSCLNRAIHFPSFLVLKFHKW